MNHWELKHDARKSLFLNKLNFQKCLWINTAKRLLRSTSIYMILFIFKMYLFLLQRRFFFCTYVLYKDGVCLWCERSKKGTGL